MVEEESRRLAVWELASIVVTVLIVEWVVVPFAGRSSPSVFVPLAAGVVLLFASARLRGETVRDLGLRFDNFTCAARLLFVPMVVSTFALICLGWWLQNAGFGEPRARNLLLKMASWGVVWGLVQQYVLQAFVNRRAQIVFGKGARSILLVASLFALLHAPNLWLSVATFAGGLLWAWVYQRAPNLFALALSHGVMSWVLISWTPAPLLKGMRVGYNYFL